MQTGKALPSGSSTFIQSITLPLLIASVAHAFTKAKIHSSEMRLFCSIRVQLHINT